MFVCYKNSNVIHELHSQHFIFLIFMNGFNKLECYITLGWKQFRLFCPFISYNENEVFEYGPRSANYNKLSLNFGSWFFGIFKVETPLALLQNVYWRYAECQSVDLLYDKPLTKRNSKCFFHFLKFCKIKTFSNVYPSKEVLLFSPWHLKQGTPTVRERSVRLISLHQILQIRCL